jgi:hypothetical protein
VAFRAALLVVAVGAVLHAPRSVAVRRQMAIFVVIWRPFTITAAFQPTAVESKVQHSFLNQQEVFAESRTAFAEAFLRLRNAKIRGDRR